MGDLDWTQCHGETIMQGYNSMLYVRSVCGYANGSLLYVRICMCTFEDVIWRRLMVELDSEVVKMLLFFVTLTFYVIVTVSVFSAIMHSLLIQLMSYRVVLLWY